MCDPRDRFIPVDDPAHADIVAIGVRGVAGARRTIQFAQILRRSRSCTCPELVLGLSVIAAEPAWRRRRPEKRFTPTQITRRPPIDRSSSEKVACPMIAISHPGLEWLA